MTFPKTAIRGARPPAGGATTFSTCAVGLRTRGLPPAPDNTPDKTDSGGKKSL